MKDVQTRIAQAIGELVIALQEANHRADEWKAKFKALENGNAASLQRHELPVESDSIALEAETSIR